MSDLTDAEMYRLQNELLVQALFEVLEVNTPSVQAEVMRRANKKVQETLTEFSARQLSAMMFHIDKFD